MGKRLRVKTRRRRTRTRKTTAASSKLHTTEEYLSSADLIGGNEDLLRNILIRIPEKSLSRFKSVSKTWLSVISHPNFSLLWHTNHIPSPSAFFYRPDYHQYYSFIPLDHREKNNSLHRIFNSNSFYLPIHPYNEPTLLHQSCNGLLLLTIDQDYDHALPSDPFPNCVYNPTTNRLKFIPDPTPLISSYVRRYVYLAFDPSILLHFKIILFVITFENNYPSKMLLIYSSETDTWSTWESPPGSLFFENGAINIYYYQLMLEYGVFFDGAIHWPAFFDSISLCFDLDEECCIQIPMPPIQGGEEWRTIRYFGESGGHLHLIDSEDSAMRFNVFEMENDYSEWFVKYNVDLIDALGWRFIAYGWDTKRFDVVILGLVVNGDEFEGEESSVLVMHLPAGEIIISYNLKNNKLKKLCPLSLNDQMPYAIGTSSMVNKFIRSPVRF